MCKAFLTLAMCMIIASSQCHGYRILGLFHVGAYSHFSFAKPLVRALSESGHDVTVVSMFPDPSTNYTDIPLEGKISTSTWDISVSRIDSAAKKATYSI